MNWRRELSSQSGRAGAGGHCEHAVRDGWSAKIHESFGFLPRAVAGSSVVASAMGCYELSECVVASTDFLPASDTPPGMLARQLGRSSEFLEFLGFPSRRIEQPPAFGLPLTVPVTVGVPTATTTTTITVRPATASAIGTVLVVTIALPSTGAPLLTMAMPAAYTRPASSMCAGHALQTGPASSSARPFHEAVGAINVRRFGYGLFEGIRQSRWPVLLSLRPGSWSRTGQLCWHWRAFRAHCSWQLRCQNQRGWSRRRSSCCQHCWATHVRRVLGVCWSERLC